LSYTWILPWLFSPHRAKIVLWRMLENVELQFAWIDIDALVVVA